jgi:hypothetical protein
MNSDKFEPKNLLKEKKLWDIYLASRRIPYSRFNIMTTVIIIILLFLTIWCCNAPIEERISTIREFSGLGLNLSLSTLGFLLAGFTIFATVSQPLLLVAMSRVEHPDSGLSYLKHNFFIFMRVFIYYLFFATFCLLIIIFGHKNGLMSVLINQSPNPEKIKFLTVNITYILLFSGYYFLIMQLKSFVFNIYHAVMTSIRWNAEGYNKE